MTLLRFSGIKPDAMLGSLMGEVAAAHCAGVIALEDAVKVIQCQSRSQAKVIGREMVVVGNISVKEI